MPALGLIVFCVRPTLFQAKVSITGGKHVGLNEATAAGWYDCAQCRHLDEAD